MPSLAEAEAEAEAEGLDMMFTAGELAPGSTGGKALTRADAQLIQRHATRLRHVPRRSTRVAPATTPPARRPVPRVWT
jgi:hypothetical protein